MDSFVTFQCLKCIYYMGEVRSEENNDDKILCILWTNVSSKLL